MCICCPLNPTSPGLYFNQTFPKELINRLERESAGTMRVLGALIIADSNWADLVALAVEGDNKQALEAYDKAFLSYKSGGERIEEILVNVPEIAAEFSALAERKLTEEVSNLGLDRVGLDYKAFFATQLLGLQRVKDRVDTLLALESCGRKLVQKGDFLAFDRLMAESIRALCETIGKNIAASVAAYRQYSEFGLLITREIQRSEGKGRGPHRKY